jgi:hypothetical protein
MDIYVTVPPAGIKPETAARPPRGVNYTLRSSSDPRGRLRGGGVCGVEEAVVGDFAPPEGNAPGPIGGVARTRARWTCAGAAPDAPCGAAGAGLAAAGCAIALAIPIKVAGDNMARTLEGTD